MIEYKQLMHLSISGEKYIHVYKIINHVKSYSTCNLLIDSWVFKFFYDI